MSEHGDSAPTQTSVYGIEELAELGGVSRRTVRYYVQRGLLPPPTGTGRGKHYTADHLDALIRVRDWQQAGVSLDEIKRRTDGTPPLVAPARAEPMPVSSAPPARAWLRFEFGDAVEVHARAGALDGPRLARLLGAVAAALASMDEDASEVEAPRGSPEPGRDDRAGPDGEDDR